MQSSNISFKMRQANSVQNPDTSLRARQADTIPNPTKPIPQSMQFASSLSDKELYRKCQYYGTAARMWRQKFIGLLPEVNKRRLYEKKVLILFLNLHLNFAGFRINRFVWL